MSVLTAQKIDRYEQILSSLADLTYATREQLQVINNLGGDRNARRILYDMEKSGYIKSVRHEQKIYYADTRLQRKEIQHILMRNDMYIKCGMPFTWKKEAPLLMNGKTVIISDARYKTGDRYYFIEIDNTQSMRKNYDKIKRYAEVFEIINKKHHPTLIWYTLSNNRKVKLDRACSNVDIKFNIFSAFISLRGRLDGTRDVCNITHKAPIVIDPVSGMYFFPTASPHNKNCSWLAHSHIADISPVKNGMKTAVKFTTGKTIMVDVSYGSMRNQLNRTAQFRYKLDERMRLNV